MEASTNVVLMMFANTYAQVSNGKTNMGNTRNNERPDEPMQQTKLAQGIWSKRPIGLECFLSAPK